jgi:hypothetical protein
VNYKRSLQYCQYKIIQISPETGRHCAVEAEILEQENPARRERLYSAVSSAHSAQAMKRGLASSLDRIWHGGPCGTRLHAYHVCAFLLTIIHSQYAAQADTT